MLKLYHFWSSTCSRKVRICLAEKKIDWESNHVDIVDKRDNLEDWYLKLNPNGVVPTLMHDDRTIIESNIIIEYLDDCFPETALRPDDPYKTAQMRLWMDRAETLVHKNINIISWNKRHMKRMSKYSHEEHRKILERFPNLEKRKIMITRLENGVSSAEEMFAEKQLSSFMDEMENALNKNPWLTGESFSLADIAIAPFIERFHANLLNQLVDFSKRPNIGIWWRNLTARNSYTTTYAFQNPDAQ